MKGHAPKRRWFLALTLLPALVLLAGQTTGRAQQHGARHGWTAPGAERPARRLDDVVWAKEAPAVPAGTSYGTFYSPSMGHDVGYVIYLPPGYAGSENRFPVIYFLHGIGGDEVGASRNVRYLKAAIADGAIRPCIAVYVNGACSAFYSDSPDGEFMVETSIVKELIPHIDAEYRTIASREGRAVEGFSMGGLGSMKLALRYPDMFCSAVTYGAALMEAEFLVGQFQDEYQRIFGGDLDRVRANFVWQLAPENRDALVENGVAIAMFAGTEDPTHRNNERFHELLSRLRVEHRYQEVEGVSHRLNEYFAELGSAGYARHEAALSAQTLETRAANR